MMGSLFRSEEMTLCLLYLQSETAYACVAELGEMGVVQFKDLNTDVNVFKRKFVAELRRCEEMERQLRYFEHEMWKEGLPIQDYDRIPESPAPGDLIDLEATYASHESEVREMTASVFALEQTRAGMEELQQVLHHTTAFFLRPGQYPGLEQSPRFQGHADIELVDIPERIVHDVSDQIQPYIRYVNGVIDSCRLPGFTRLLWFACKGNVFIRHVDIPNAADDPSTARKSVFMAFAQGEQLIDKVKKICDGFRATLYPCPDAASERRQLSVELLTKMADLDTVLVRSREQRHRILLSISENLHRWRVKVLKVKAVYHTLSMLSSEGRNLVAECWLPVAEIGAVQLLLNRVTERAGTTAPSLLHTIDSDCLPTYHKTNKFTSAFQSIIDAYGLASYREVNAAPFAIITFPFLFSVMFGDAGHGLIMLAFALFLVIRERHLVVYSETSEIFRIIFGGRYMILLMALFSIYSGLLYNDTFSKSLNVFGSSWTARHMNATDVKLAMLSPATAYVGHPYPFGVDPMWQMSKNKISFTNSFKKKISVIFGVCQMLLGVILSLCNHIHFRQPLKFVCDFLPQLLFLLSIFAYLCALIIVKWVVFDISKSGCAPNLLIGLINMFMMKYPEAPCSVKPWYPSQRIVQSSLLAVAFVSALWMLFAKPVYLHMRERSRLRQSAVWGGVLTEGASQINVNVTIDTAAILPEGSHASDLTAPTTCDPEQFDLTEVVIQQAIHTIEFCLGCISHTASYLRLWALSLAHAELSEVLWTMVLRTGLATSGYLGSFTLFLVFTPFALLTVTILLLMEGLSAFLHTLRLHWVEFQSKFYAGEGFPFQPFSFNEILSNTERAYSV